MSAKHLFVLAVYGILWGAGCDPGELRHRSTGSIEDEPILHLGDGMDFVSPTPGGKYLINAQLHLQIKTENYNVAEVVYSADETIDLGSSTDSASGFPVTASFDALGVHTVTASGVTSKGEEIASAMVKIEITEKTTSPPDNPPDGGGIEGPVVCPKARSSRLKSGVFNPMPGGTISGYEGDTGLDIHGLHFGIYALAEGTLDYSEPGHTPWNQPPDTPNSIRVKLKEPIPWKGKSITHVWYTHLAQLQFNRPPEGTPVSGGDCLGLSGYGNKVPHLHLGLILNNGIDQGYGDVLSYLEVTQVLGDFNQGEKLPE